MFGELLAGAIVSGCSLFIALRCLRGDCLKGQEQEFPPLGLPGSGRMTVALEAAARTPVSGVWASHLGQSGVHGFPVFAVERVSFPRVPRWPVPGSGAGPGV